MCCSNTPLLRITGLRPQTWHENCQALPHGYIGTFPRNFSGLVHALLRRCVSSAGLLEIIDDCIANGGGIGRDRSSPCGPWPCVECSKSLNNAFCAAARSSGRIILIERVGSAPPCVRACFCSTAQANILVMTCLLAVFFHCPGSHSNQRWQCKCCQGQTALTTDLITRQ